MHQNVKASVAAPCAKATTAPRNAKVHLVLLVARVKNAAVRATLTVVLLGVLETIARNIALAKRAVPTAACSRARFGPHNVQNIAMEANAG